MQESNGSKEIDSQASLALQERLREANEKVCGPSTVPRLLC